MTYKKLRRRQTIVLVVLFFFMVLIGFYTLGALSVSVYFQDTVEEVRELEEKSLLEAPPLSASAAAQDAIGFLGNSKNIERYSQSVFSDFKRFGYLCLGLTIAFFFMAGRRFYYRKSKFSNTMLCSKKI